MPAYAKLTFAHLQLHRIVAFSHFADYLMHAASTAYRQIARRAGMATQTQALSAIGSLQL